MILKQIAEMKQLILLTFIVLISLSGFTQEGKDTEKALLPNTRQLIYEGNRSGEGYFSEDGRYLIFQSEREPENPFYQIYILDFETGDIHRVSPGTGKTTCAYFQWNGDRVLFASSHLDPDAVKKQKEELEIRASGKKRRYSWDYEPWMEIFSAKRDGSDIKRLTDQKGYDAEGSWSPDGKLIVYSSNAEAYARKLTKEEKERMEVDPSYFCDLFIMNADGSGKRKLTSAPGYDGGPFFSPDGKRVIFRRFSEDGHSADVYTINIDGTDERRLTDFGCLSWAPFYHPSGDYIIWAANKEGYANFELYITDVDGTKEPVRVTYTDGFDGLPVFSPDGTKLVWTSSRTPDGKAQLFISDWNDELARELIARSPVRKGAQRAINTIFKPEISVPELTEKLSYIASDDLKGRLTGSEGAQQAAGYITSIFNNLGLEPLAGHDGYLWPFEFVERVDVPEGGNQFSVKGRSLELNRDFRPLSSSANGELSAEVVFAGYGLKVDDGTKFHYDSYQDLEVKDKIVMVLEGIPDSLSDEQRQLFERSIASGYKQMLARQHGAAGILVVTDVKRLRESREVVGTSGIPSVAVSEEAANLILKDKGQTVEKLRAMLSNGDPKGNEHLFATGTGIDIRIQVERVVGHDNNIVGVVRSGNPDAKYIFVGAHYDHLGLGEVNSRSSGEDRHKVHNGADDNGSGTVTVVELAEYFAGLQKSDPEKIRHHLVFCLWSGEELGLLGSGDFANNLPVPAEQVVAYINFDMVGRMKENRLEVQGIGSSDGWKPILEKKNIVTGFDLRLGSDPYLPTDATSFYMQRIPVISFFTGIHNDYHTATDDVDKIDFEDMQRVTRFASLVIQELMKPDQTLAYKEVKLKRPKGGKGAYSVTLGTIPAYAGSDEPGVQIQGVRPGGPAEKAGLQADDFIIGLNGKEVSNIYDFMNILGELKPDVAVPIVVRRNGTKVELKIVPEAKE